MWNLWKRKSEICSHFRNALEDSGDVAAVPQDLQQHLRACASCQSAAGDFAKSRAILRTLPSRAAQPAPWFVPRVMAAISAREAELRFSLDTWSVLPRLAAQLSWVSAIALLLACTWLYQRPRSTPSSSNDGSFESLVDTAASSPNQDDILVSHVEAQQ